MKLDKRIIEGKKPLDCFDSEYAKQFIGKKGFFANELDQFCDLSKMNEATLKNVWQNETCCFFPSAIAMMFKYFLPSEWVNMEEPEWRPYLIDEWLQEHNFGDVIEFRTKINHVELTAMFIGMDSGPQNSETRIMLGCNAYSFDSLFEHYELLDKTNDGKFAWKPFGVEVTK